RRRPLAALSAKLCRILAKPRSACGGNQRSSPRSGCCHCTACELAGDGLPSTRGPARRDDHIDARLDAQRRSVDDQLVEVWIVPADAAESAFTCGHDAPATRPARKPGPRRRARGAPRRERALRASGAPVRYTEGYNPHLRMSMGPALPLGHESKHELFDVDVLDALTDAHVTAVNARLPEGLRITACAELPK